MRYSTLPSILTGKKEHTEDSQQVLFADATVDYPLRWPDKKRPGDILLMPSSLPACDAIPLNTDRSHKIIQHYHQV